MARLTMPTRVRRMAMVGLLVALGAATLSGTSIPAASAQSPGTIIVGLTGTNRLIRFPASDPATIIGIAAVSGLDAGEVLVAIDGRPATRQLYGLTNTGRLYTINPLTGAAARAGTAALGVELTGEVGFDFNPVPDRIRVVNEARINLRANPITGGTVDANLALPGTQLDGTLAYAAGDPNFGTAPRIVAAAYTNNVAGATVTTNYAIDANLDTLVTQGSVNGSPVSPNSGQLFTVGSLGINVTGLTSFDIAPDGTAYLVATAFAGDANTAALGVDFTLGELGATSSVLYRVNLATGGATRIGPIEGAEVIRAIAVLL